MASTERVISSSHTSIPIDTYTTNTGDEHPVSIELAIAGVKQLQIYALDRTATGISFLTVYYYNRYSPSSL